MEKLYSLIEKCKKIVRLNLISLILFCIGVLSLSVTVVLTVKTTHPFYLYSLIPTIPFFIVGGIYDHVVNQILREILRIFKDRLKWGINNDDIYNTTHSQIKEASTTRYTIIVKCPQKHAHVVSSLVQEIVTDFNKELPPKLQLLPSVKVVS